MSDIDLSKWQCGLWPNSRWKLRYLLPWYKVFHEAAVNHDLWWYMLWWTSKDRLLADRQFLIDMLKSIEDFELFKWILYLILACIYYIFVRMFWFIFFGSKS
jgi:hypothetical protein